MCEQTHSSRLLYLGVNAHCYVHMFTEADWRTCNALWSTRKYILKYYDWQSAPLKLKTPKLKAEVLEKMLYSCATCSPHVRVPLWYAARSSAQLPTPLQQMVEEKSHWPPDFLTRRPYEDEEQKRQIRDAHGRHETVKTCDIRRTLGGCGFRGREKKGLMRRHHEEIRASSIGTERRPIVT